MSIEQRTDATAGGMSRRRFLGLGGASAAFLAGSAALGPLQTLGIRSALGAPMERAEGYGPLVEAGDLLLPRGFSYRVISRAGEPMSDGNPNY